MEREKKRLTLMNVLEMGKLTRPREWTSFCGSPTIDGKLPGGRRSERYDHFLVFGDFANASFFFFCFRHEIEEAPLHDFLLLARRRFFYSQEESVSPAEKESLKKTSRRSGRLRRRRRRRPPSSTSSLGTLSIRNLR